MLKILSSIGLVMMCISVGCASLHEEVRNDIHLGDTKDAVVDLLGEPESFYPSQQFPGGTAWIYKRREDACGIVLKNDVVVNTLCVRDQNYRNPAALFAQGFNQGLANSYSHKNRMTCTTRALGNVATTDCD